MSMLARHSGLLRWLVPVGVAVTVIGGGAAVRATTAAAEPTLPSRSAAQLLVDLQTAKLDGLHGTVTQRADLGLPALPGLGASSGGTDLATLASGSHTLRVWYSGPDKARVALLDTLGETDFIANGRDLWIWKSDGNTAVHRTLPAEQTGSRAPSARPSPVPSSPQDVAKLALEAIDPSTVVSTAGSARVAGRSAYELVLAPRDNASLIGQIRVAIDAEHHVPLRAQVYGRGADTAAFEVAFTQVSFNRPDAAEFRFNPPPGAKVQEGTADTGSLRDQVSGATKPAVIGSGWTSVLAVRLPQGSLPVGDAPAGDAPAAGDGPRHGSAAGAGSLTTLLNGLPTVSGSWGSGRVLAGKLFSVLITDDGRLLVGAVPTDRLTQAAADPAAALPSGR